MSIFKHVVSLILAAAICLSAGAPCMAATGIALTSRSAVLMDADSGETLYAKKKDIAMYPASITKILTGLLAAENADPQEIAGVKQTAVGIPRGYAHIALLNGDAISVDDAMYAMLLASANDAANVLAEHVAGSQKKFARLMNERAEEIGASRSRFTNAHGMPDNNHYTTAYDMALITREAISNEAFMRYFGAASHSLPAFNHQTKPTKISSHHSMLLADKTQYDSRVVGGKIGYTRESAHTMATVAEQDGRVLICVVMGGTANGKYSDTQKLLDYGFGM